MEMLLRMALSNAVAAALLALPVAVAARSGRRPALAHGLWLLVLWKFLTPPLWPVPVDWPALAERATPNVAPVSELRRGASLAFTHLREYMTSLEGLVPLEQGLRPTPLAVTPSAGPSARIFPARPEPRPRAPRGPFGASGWRRVWQRLSRPRWPVGVAAIWLSGSALWVVLAARRMGRFRRLLRFAEAAPVTLQGQTAALAARLGLSAAPRVALVPGPVTPMVWAWGGRPWLLVPSALWKRLDARQRETLLIHELAHLKRRDHWVRALEVLATALYWWHPVVWWARRALREAEEQCCDAWVLWADPRSSRAYATALLETVDFVSEAPPAVPALASGMGQVHHLRRRLIMIKQGGTPHALSWAGRWALRALAVLLLPLAPSWAQRAETKTPQPPRAERPDPDAAGATSETYRIAILSPDGDRVAQAVHEALQKAEEQIRQAVQQDRGPNRDDAIRKVLDQVGAAIQKAIAVHEPVRTVVVRQPRLSSDVAGDVIARFDGQSDLMKAVVFRFLSLPNQLVPVPPNPPAAPPAPGGGPQPPAVPVPPAPPARPPSGGAPGPAAPAPPIGLPGGAPGMLPGGPPGTPSPGGDTAAADQERRLRDLERKLDRLLDELERLKRDRDDRGRSQDSPRSS